MDHRPIYSNAPIREAIVDVRVALPTNVKLADLKRVVATYLPDYPDRKERHEAVGRFEFGEAVSVFRRQQSNGSTLHI